MSRIIADPSFLAQVSTILPSFEVCDESGQVVGWFVPNAIQPFRKEDWVWEEFTAEELEAARRDPTEYTTEQVLEKLRQL
jgi:hypothetical protein